MSSSEDEGETSKTTEEHFGGNYSPHGGRLKKPIDPKTVEQVLLGPTKEEKKNFKKSMKKSNLYYKKIVLDENMKKFMGEKG